MLTFQELYTRCTIIVGDDSTAAITLFKALINETYKLISNQEDWWFFEATKTYTTTASQQNFLLPRGFSKLESFSVTVGDTKYYTTEDANLKHFNKLNSQGTNVTSDFPLYHNLRDGNLRVFPPISTAGLTATLEYVSTPIDMTEDDYTTGNVSNIANGNTTVTGSGTIWVSSMVGSYIRITSDGRWYKVASVTSNTALELDNNYEGTTISSGSEAYTIGELPLLPDGFEGLLVYRPIGIYYLQKEEINVARTYYSEEDRRPGLYESLYRDLQKSQSNRTTEVAWNSYKFDGDGYDPNLNPNNITITS